jgi:hypothetical protein
MIEVAFEGLVNKASFSNLVNRLTVQTGENYSETNLENGLMPIYERG